MERRIVLDQVAGLALYGNCLSCGTYFHRDLQRNRQRSMYVNVLCVAEEAGAGDREVVVVRRNVREVEFAFAVGGH